MSRQNTYWDQRAPQPPTTAPAALRPHALTAYWTIGALFSIVTNLLMLVSPLYMLQVYDRVLTSGSVDTLLSLTLLAVALLMVYGFADMARRKIMVLASRGLPEQFGQALFRINLASPYAARTLPHDMANLNTVQNFLANGLILPLFDLPFSPFFVLVMFLIHPWIGWLGLASVMTLTLIAILTEVFTRQKIELAQNAERMTQNFTDDLSRQQSAIVSLGMTAPLYQRWAKRKDETGQLTQAGAQRSGALGSIIRSLRIILQISVLGLGGYLVLQHQATAGAIIAGSILLGRALGPIDQLVGLWRQFVQTQRAWRHLKQQLNQLEGLITFTPLPRPRAEVRLTNLAVGWPGAQSPLLPEFNSVFPPGTLTLLFGRTGSGKTSFLQTLAGAWPPLSGDVSLGSREIHRWHVDDRGRYMGYLPQHVELLPGTVLENIARFQAAPLEAIMQAAKAAGCHDLILSLPEGYDTQIGHLRSDVGIALSAGQTQQIGLARAFFGAPAMLLLDEPTANLDPRSVQDLKAYLKSLKSPETVILIASHDLRLTDLSDTVLTFQKNLVSGHTPSDFLRKLGHTSSHTAKPSIVAT